MHVIAGLPRSGSTLLCNILNQNPIFHATSTSILPQMFASLIAQMSNSLELKGDLGRDRDGTEDRIKRSLHAFCNAWHADNSDKILFDKARAWVHHILALQELYPQAKVIVTLRDLREVFASIEKQHRKNPLLDPAPGPQAKGIVQRAEMMFNPDGMIGHCLQGIQDILARRLTVFWWKFEEFAENPAQVMSDLYAFLEEPAFRHDFEDVVNTATDPDHLYLFKYPHNGSGSVKIPPTSWHSYMSPAFSREIMQRYAWYGERFGYQQPVQPNNHLVRQPANGPAIRR